MTKVYKTAQEAGEHIGHARYEMAHSNDDVFTVEPYKYGYAIAMFTKKNGKDEFHAFY